MISVLKISLTILLKRVKKERKNWLNLIKMHSRTGNAPAVFNWNRYPRREAHLSVSLLKLTRTTIRSGSLLPKRKTEQNSTFTLYFIQLSSHKVDIFHENKCIFRIFGDILCKNCLCLVKLPSPLFVFAGFFKMVKAGKLRKAQK